uniref:Uncharacterized protein n=1 Tax=mine drainage metagenome TaxID=410659 RepID=E6QTU0_9ZZZZ
MLVHLKLIAWVNDHVAQYWFPHDIRYIHVSLHRNSIFQAFRFVRLIVIPKKNFRGAFMPSIQTGYSSPIRQVRMNANQFCSVSRA